MGWMSTNFQTDSSKVIITKKKDRQAIYHTIEQDIRILSAELCRLSRLPYSSVKNTGKIRTVDAQIQYLEELLAAYERDQKTFE